MAGRRLGSGGALASAADVASQLLLHRQQHDEDLQKQAVELYGKFALESQIEEQRYRHEAMLQYPGSTLDPRTGAIAMPSFDALGELAPGEERDVKFGPFIRKFRSPTKEETNLQRIQEFEKTAAGLRSTKGMFGAIPEEEVFARRARILRETAPSARQDPDFQRHLESAKRSIREGVDPVAVRRLLIQEHPERANDIDLELNTPSLSTGGETQMPEAVDQDTGRPVRRLPDGRWVYAD